MIHTLYVLYKILSFQREFSQNWMVDGAQIFRDFILLASSNNDNRMLMKQKMSRNIGLYCLFMYYTVLLFVCLFVWCSLFFPG